MHAHFEAHHIRRLDGCSQEVLPTLQNVRTVGNRITTVIEISWAVRAKRIVSADDLDEA